MNTHLAAAAANCNTGTWAQRWKCGWNQPGTGPHTAAYVAGYDFGRYLFPALIVLAVILLAARATRRRKSRRSPAPATPARARAGARR
jgi:hypothetical protein